MASRQLDEEAIFHVARGITEPTVRASYLDQICAGDQALRERVEQLLQVHEQEQVFLKSATEPAATAEWVDERPVLDQRIGRWKLREKLGEGGFGEVWAAEQSQPIRRHVAVKIIKPGMDSRSVLARFDAERQALALMDHPNIARILDGGTTPQGRPYFVMELIRGLPITRYSDDNRLTVPERLRLFITVCKAVQHAHQKGIIHRDIKPSNVLVTIYDGEPQPKVIDFGIAKALNQRLSDQSIYSGVFQAIGTLAYMAPEQAELSCQDIDTRADIYGLGALLYELLTGTTPVDAKRLERAALLEAIRIIKDEEPPKASTRLSSLGETVTSISTKRHTDPAGLQKLVRGELDWILLKALDKNRTRRYETASSLAEDVRRLLDGEPVLACPPTWRYRCGKFLRRNALAVAATVTIGLCLVAGIVGTSTGWIAAQSNLTAARAAEQDERRSREQAVQAEERERRKAAELETLLGQHREELYHSALNATLSLAPDAEQRIAEVRRFQLEEDRLEFLEGLRAFYRGEPRQAAERFRAALRHRPDNLAAAAALTRTFDAVGDYQAWIKGAYSLYSSRPQRPEDRLFLAQALMVIGDPGRAEQLADQACIDLPSAAAFATRAHAQAWRALLNTGDTQVALDAAADMRTIRRIYGDSPHVLDSGLFSHVAAMLLAGPQHSAYPGLRQEAEAIHARSLRIEYYAMPSLMRAAFLEMVDRPIEAEQEYQRMSAFGGDNQNWTAWYALALSRNGKHDKARPLVRRLDSWALMLAAAVLGDSPDDRQFVLESARKNESSADISLHGDHNLRPLLFTQQRETAIELARQLAPRQPAESTSDATWERWEREKLRFYVGDLDADGLLRVAGPSPLLRCDAHSLIAADYYSRGELDKAREHFQATTDTRVTWWPSYYVALIFRDRLAMTEGPR